MKGQRILVADSSAESIADSGEPIDGTNATAASPASGTGARRKVRTRQANVRRERPEWRLDNRTRDVGRRGVEQARAALRASRGRRPAA